MSVKFNGKIEWYGANKFESARQRLDIPKLPDELFNLARVPEPKSKIGQVEQSYDKNTMMQ